MSTVGFWREIKQDNRSWSVQSNRLGAIGRPWYIFPDGNGPRGSFASFTDLAPNLRSRDIIILGGVLREQAIAPLDVYDVTVIGAANTPRQATTATGGVPANGTPTGGGACWLPPHTGAVAATPLIELRAAGWSFENIEFSPYNGSAAIRLTRSAAVDTIDSSHFRVSGCKFGSNGGTTQIGIEDNGGSGFGLIEGCTFQGLTTAIKGLSTAAAIPQMWEISRNRFNGNTNAIGMSLTEGLVYWNTFRQAANDTNFKVNLVAVAGQGSLNQVLKNFFSDAVANVTIAKGYKPGTTDVWRNWVTDQADEVFVVPA
jgi:hypothetical protein